MASLHMHAMTDIQQHSPLPVEICAGLSVWTLDKVSYQLAKIVRSHTVGVDTTSAEESER